MARFKKLCQDLAKLPVELAHQIISDLAVWDVLHLLAYDDPHITAVISTHAGYSTLLGKDEGTFLQTQETVKCCVRVYSKAGLRYRPPEYNHWHSFAGALQGGGQLSCTIDVLLSIASKEDCSATAVTLKQMKMIIWEFLDEQIHAVRLEDHVDRSIFPNGIPKLYDSESAQELEECADVVLHAKRALLEKSYDQLLWAASMLEENPDILKRTLDPEQKRRPNLAHILSRMRYAANRFNKCEMPNFVATEHFSYVFFPLIPFDTALKELLQRMEKHGLISEKGELNEINEQSHAYPPSIQKHAEVVIEGMPLFFMKQGSQVVHKFAKEKGTNDRGDPLRTINTLWSDQTNSSEVEVDMNDPIFTVHKLVPSRFLRTQKRALAREPNDKREEVWLTSFVALYRYLETLEKASAGAS